MAAPLKNLSRHCVSNAGPRSVPCFCQLFAADCQKTRRFPLTCHRSGSPSRHTRSGAAHYRFTLILLAVAKTFPFVGPIHIVHCTWFPQKFTTGSTRRRVHRMHLRNFRKKKKLRRLCIALLTLARYRPPRIYVFSFTGSMLSCTASQ